MRGVMERYAIRHLLDGDGLLMPHCTFWFFDLSDHLGTRNSSGLGVHSLAIIVSKI